MALPKWAHSIKGCALFMSIFWLCFIATQSVLFIANCVQVRYTIYIPIREAIKEMATIQTQTFGFEFEFFGMTRKEAAESIAEQFGSRAYYTGNHYYTTDNKGRKWKVVRDGSINATSGDPCEMVTPILKYEDIETLQEIMRRLRSKGAKTNQSCGIHIHVGADQHNAKSLKNLMNIFYSKQDMIYRSLEVLSYRESQYAMKLKDEKIGLLKKEKPQTLRDMGEIWYGGKIEDNQMKYNSTRYHGLNLHNVWYGSTIEFRLFNSTTHAGKAKAYIQFCLAMSALAINSRSASSKQTVSDNEKYTFRTWLLRLGLIGDEFKTCRTHMLANLEGNSAWRTPQAQ
jgi:hypothetical protein